MLQSSEPPPGWLHAHSRYVPSGCRAIGISSAMAGSLEAIRYKREGGQASLHLLEQRKLPLETEWLDIPGPEAAWTAIRDMTVRGAPAIGELPPPLLLAPASETPLCALPCLHVIVVNCAYTKSLGCVC